MSECWLLSPVSASPPVSLCECAQKKKEGKTDKLKSSDLVLRYPEVLVFYRCSLLTEAEVQSRALCDRRRGARTGYSTGGDAAVFTHTHTQKIQLIMF